MIAVQASLTDYQKMVAELFDNKISGLGFSALFIALSRGMSLDEFVHYDFMTNLASFDGGIATWKEKVVHDAVRPVSAIRHLYRNRRITGWAGPGRGVVDDLPGVEWRSYLNTGNHPEYPSGSLLFLRGACAGQQALPRVRCVRLVSAGARRIVRDRARRDARNKPHARSVEHVHRIRRRLQPQPGLGRGPLRPRNDRRTEDVSSDWRSCVRVPPASRARNGEVAKGRILTTRLMQAQVASRSCTASAVCGGSGQPCGRRGGRAPPMLFVEHAGRSNPVESSIVVGCTLVLSAVAVAAGFLPARRGSRIDAMAALRHE